jgi:hypothetical protein
VAVGLVTSRFRHVDARMRRRWLTGLVCWSAFVGVGCDNRSSTSSRSGATCLLPDPVGSIQLPAPMFPGNPTLANSIVIDFGTTEAKNAFDALYTKTIFANKVLQNLAQRVFVAEDVRGSILVFDYRADADCRQLCGMLTFFDKDLAGTRIVYVFKK